MPGHVQGGHSFSLARFRLEIDDEIQSIVRRSRLQTWYLISKKRAVQTRAGPASACRLEADLPSSYLMSAEILCTEQKRGEE